MNDARVENQDIRPFLAHGAHHVIDALARGDQRDRLLAGEFVAQTAEKRRIGNRNYRDAQR